MKCDGCGNENAYAVRVNISEGICSELCDRCGSARPTGIPDVYFPGAYLDPHLVDTNKPEQANGVWISSKRQKAEIMKRLDFREAGDKRHGARL